MLNSAIIDLANKRVSVFVLPKEAALNPDDE
jgi:hypothetical protein